MSVRSINPYLVEMLRPQTNSNSWFKKQSGVDIMADTFKLVHSIQNIARSIKSGVVLSQDSGLDHQKYITPNNPTIRTLARSITNFSDSSDTKMFKIEQWVQKHIEYKTDLENYRQLERWAYPVETLNKKSGDCEDQAFLVHSLGLAASVEPDRLRTYGGLVFDPGSASPGGHGWTAYRRETDNKWVTVDSTYYAVQTPIKDRELLSADLRYIEDFWYIQQNQTIATPYANKIRYAKGHNINIKV